MNWNKDQLEAIGTKGKSILVSAAAGSGKTAVLSQRILQKLMDQEHPVDIDEFLIVTFTRAAAGEMRERIQGLIMQELEKDPQNEHLSRQLSLIYNAQICTIDSYCSEILHQYFHLIDLDPSYRIGEEPELVLLADEALKEILEEEYEKASPSFLEFVESYAPGKREDTMEDVILQLHRFSQSHAYPKEFLQECIQNYELGPEQLENQDWLIDIKEYCKGKIAQWVQVYSDLVNKCTMPDGPDYYLETIEAEQLNIARIEELEDHYEIMQQLNAFSWGTLKRKVIKDEREKEIKEQVKSARDKVKKEMKKLVEEFSYDIESQASALQGCKKMVEEMVRLTLVYSDRFLEKKLEKSILDFSDVEHLALKILRSDDASHSITDAAKDLSEGYEEIMIDEYQDSNDVQEQILTAIAKQNKAGNPLNLFMVGDVKQSIYRFRMARPELFNEKYMEFQLTKSRDENALILLKKNYRSRDEVVDTVNVIFENIMHRELGGIEYDQEARLVRDGQFKASQKVDEFKSELLLVETNESKESPYRLEARMIAKKINEIVGKSLVTDKETQELRQATYKDIVILSRSLSHVREYMEELEDYSIPVKCSESKGLLNSREVRFMLEFLKVLDNPRQDIPMTSVLYSPLVGISENELAQIRLHNRECSFYECIFDYAREEGENELKAKLRDFLALLEDLTQKCEYLSLRELIEEIYDQTGYLEYAAMLPQGTQRKANLILLSQRAAEYEKSGNKSLYRFVHYLTQVEQHKKVKMEEANLGEINENVVNIMTIHKSKGLEFPIVFVSNLGTRFNEADNRDVVLKDTNYGIAIESFDIKNRSRSDTIMKKAFSHIIRRDNLGEELRVLYVACTRAQDKLILTGACKSAQKLSDEFSSDTPLYAELFDVHNYLDWLSPILFQHKELVDVTTYQASDLLPIESMSEKSNYAKWILERPALTSLEEEIKRELEWTYPYERDMLLPTKVSVSDLKHLDIEKASQDNIEPPRMDYQLEQEEAEVYIPTFIQEVKEENLGALMGTAMHRYLELVDFSRDYAGYENLDPTWHKERNQLLHELKEEFVKSGRMQKEDASRLNMKGLCQFFDSLSCYRMHQAALKGTLLKEQPFVLGLQAKEVKEFPKIGHVDSQELVLMQGIIDVFWEEDGQLVVLDYKTDRVSSPKELIDRYGGQLDNYKKALERATGKKVKEKILYSFSLGKEISLDERSLT